MRKRLVTIALAAALGLIGLQGVASADPSAGNSGHSNNGSTQCKAGGNDHCPPFGP